MPKKNKNRVRKWTISAFILILFLFIVTYLYTYENLSRQEYIHSTYILSDKEHNLITEGDIILRQGYGIVSSAIVKKLNEEYQVSHCGIIIKDTLNNCFNVIHTLSSSISQNNGMQQCSLHEFVKDARENSIIIVRFKTDNFEKITKKAYYYLEKHLPFDHHFDLSDSSTFFCSELPIRILRDEYNTDITNNYPDHRFSMFLNPENFDIIINHHIKNNINLTYLLKNQNHIKFDCFIQFLFILYTITYNMKYLQTRKLKDNPRK